MGDRQVTKIVLLITKFPFKMTFIEMTPSLVHISLVHLQFWLLSFEKASIITVTCFSFIKCVFNDYSNQCLLPLDLHWGSTWISDQLSLLHGALIALHLNLTFNCVFLPISSILLFFICMEIQLTMYLLLFLNFILFYQLVPCNLQNKHQVFIYEAEK